MTHYGKIRNQTIEGVARDRIHFDRGDYENEELIKGDFGVTKLDRNKYTNFDDAYDAAYAEALRLEMEWLKSESEVG